MNSTALIPPRVAAFASRDFSAFYRPTAQPATTERKLEGGINWQASPMTQAHIGWPYDHRPVGHTPGFNYNQIGYGGLDVRRKNATRESTSTLKAWLYEHIKNPYPTKGEKIMLAIITKMSLTQVSTWFANARRRLKKENKMQWSPRTRTGDDDDDDDDDDRNSYCSDVQRDVMRAHSESFVQCNEQDDADDVNVIDDDDEESLPSKVLMNFEQSSSFCLSGSSESRKSSSTPGASQERPPSVPSFLYGSRGTSRDVATRQHHPTLRSCRTASPRDTYSSLGNKSSSAVDSKRLSTSFDGDSSILDSTNGHFSTSLSEVSLNAAMKSQLQSNHINTKYNEVYLNKRAIESMNEMDYLSRNAIDDISVIASSKSSQCLTDDKPKTKSKIWSIDDITSKSTLISERDASNTSTRVDGSTKDFSNDLLWQRLQPTAPDLVNWYNFLNPFLRGCGLTCQTLARPSSTSVGASFQSQAAAAAAFFQQYQRLHLLNPERYLQRNQQVLMHNQREDLAKNSTC